MLLKNVNSTSIDTDDIKRGALVWAKHMSWDEGIPGMVANVTEKMITVRFIPSYQNVENHYYITALELSEGNWQVRYSTDGMQTVKTFPATEEEDGS